MYTNKYRFIFNIAMASSQFVSLALSKDSYCVKRIAEGGFT
jgi:hypothetical protein